METRVKGYRNQGNTLFSWTKINGEQTHLKEEGDCLEIIMILSNGILISLNQMIVYSPNLTVNNQKCHDYGT